MTQALDAAVQAIDDEMFEIIHNLEIGYIEHTDAAKRMARAALRAALALDHLGEALCQAVDPNCCFADRGRCSWCQEKGATALRAHLLGEDA